MKIVMAEHFGICFGVRDAIAAAEELAKRGPFTILGELVHNPIVRERLRARGITEQGDGAPVTGRVMITAHGASDKRRAELQARNLTVADGTCPLVKHAHAQLQRLVRRGYFPVVIGLRDHVEVRGLREDFAGAFVVSGPADISELPHHSRYGIISQTTQPIERVLALVAQIRVARPEAEVLFADTVCKPTKDRQRALKELLKTVDTIVVVGGRHSNNTAQLVQSCRAAAVHAIHVERAEELRACDFVGSEVVGVTAGTSTLPETVVAVVDRLNEIAALQRSP